jgi:hypothetical protein
MRKLSIFDDPVLVAENDTFALYMTSWTQGLTEYARKMDIHGIELAGWNVVKARNKADGEEYFLLYDNNGRVVSDSDSAEEMSLKIDMIKMVRAEDNDIVEMVLRRNAGQTTDAEDQQRKG